MASDDEDLRGPAEVLDDPAMRGALEDFAREHGLDLNDLPDWIKPAEILARIPRPKPRPQPDPLGEAIVRSTGAPPPRAPGPARPERTFETWEEEADAIASGEIARPEGRPARWHPKIPWPEIDHLLVFGEPYEGQDGATHVRFPAFAEVARRFGCNEKTVSDYAKRHDCLTRRADVSKRIEEEVVEGVVTEHAAARIAGRSSVVDACDLYIERFLEAVRKGKVPMTAADFDRMVRLRSFAEGGPDARGETNVTIGLEDLQARHALAKQRKLEEPIPMLGVFQDDGELSDVVLPLRREAPKLEEDDGGEASGTGG